jgi:diguanylate cyclase (GGDEF)-like protein
MRILLAEDEAVSRRALSHILERWGYEVIVTTNGVAAWQVLQRPDTPQLAILDWMMPEMDGVQVCRAVRQQEHEPYIYILLLTAKNRKTDVIAGLEAGADDYLTKPFDLQELRVRLRTGRRIIELQTELIAAREVQRKLAVHDTLTEILNRGAILDDLQKEISRAEHEGKSVGVVMADLDHFKRINDTHGHLIGDAVLCETARRLKSKIRSYDTIGRYGGEEFLIVLPRCTLHEAAGIANRLRVCLAETPLETAEGPVAFTGSFGVAVFEGGNRKDLNALLRAVDAALYRAKRAGRNRVALDGGMEPIPALVRGADGPYLSHSTLYQVG